MVREEPTRTNWTFVTNHARVLAAIARDPGVRLRDVAVVCQLTERAVQAIVADLEQAGYLTHVRDGRRNRYRITTHTTLRHPAEAGLSVAALLDMLAPSRPGPGDSGDGGRHATRHEQDGHRPPLSSESRHHAG